MDQSTAVRPARRGLGPGMTAFVVVDVLLVLAALVALTLYLSDGRTGGDPAAGESPGAGSTGTTAPGDGRSPTTDASSGPGTFALPSGNIACEITGEAASCTIADSTAEAVPVEGCAAPAGQLVRVTADGAETPCPRGALPGPAAAGTPVLEYGESTTVGDFTCTSSTSGVTCRHDPSGAGFSLARAGHRLF